MKSAQSRLLWNSSTGSPAQETPASAAGHVSTPGRINVCARMCVLFIVPCGCRSVRWLRTGACASAASRVQCVSSTASGSAWRKHHSWSSAAEESPLPPDRPRHHLGEKQTSLTVRMLLCTSAEVVEEGQKVLGLSFYYFRSTASILQQSENTPLQVKASTFYLS